jgi:hypothetical protein
LLWSLLAAAPAAPAAGDLRPVIEAVVTAPRQAVGQAGEVRIRYRAPGANVVAVVVAVEDLDGPPLQRASRQREVGVVTRAFGREAGELAVPLAFTTPGGKRVRVVLLTDEREASDPAEVEVEATP